MSGPAPPAGAVLSEIRNRVAIITLNRPEALNALSYEMLVALRSVLKGCADEPEVRAILLKGAGDKAFCAGGDIRSLYQSFKDGKSQHREFFLAEYPLDFMLHSFPKPYVALMDGITMGGGMGLAQASTLRIVGDRTRIAMPEVGIGMFPDVGSSYFLSRLPGSLGPYLALTGAQIRGADAVYARLADVYLSAGRRGLAHRRPRIARMERGRRRGTATPDPLALRAGIAGPVVERPQGRHRRAFLALRRCPPSSHRWPPNRARNTRIGRCRPSKLMRSRSPTMMAVALRQLQRGKNMELSDCFRMELGMVEQAFQHGDLIEGVRALIIDKDNAPRWNPAPGGGRH